MEEENPQFIFKYIIVGDVSTQIMKLLENRAF
jgi:hypothetical protein